MSHAERAECQQSIIDRLEPVLNALITRRERDAVIAQAQAADAAVRDGRWLGLLHGMTIVLKDNIDTAGMRTTAGAHYRRDHVPATDATVVTRLLRAGAILVGKANLTEVAFGVHTRSAVGGQTRNPWQPARIPGGSSGGCAAALAAGYCDGALGSDTGGSVRLPAALVGIAGLRPTFGAVPGTGTLPVSEAHDTVGPMARHVDDLARLYAAIAGYDPADPWSDPRPPVDVLSTPVDAMRGRVVGVPSDHDFVDCEDEVVDRVRAALEVLEKAGARLVDIRIPNRAEAQSMLSRLLIADACRVHRSRLDADPDAGGLSDDIRERMVLGLAFSAQDIAEAQQFRQRWRRTMQDVFRSVDLVAGPTTPATAPPIDDDRSLYEKTSAVARNTFGAALAGLPALSLPCGFGRDDLPVGLQLVAPWWREDRLLAAGRSYQAATDFHRRLPPGVSAT